MESLLLWTINFCQSPEYDFLSMGPDYSGIRSRTVLPQPIGLLGSQIFKPCHHYGRPTCTVLSCSLISKTKRFSKVMVLLLNYVSQNKWLAGASEKIKVWVLAQGLSGGLAPGYNRNWYNKSLCWTLSYHQTDNAPLFILVMQNVFWCYPSATILPASLVQK